MWRAGKLILICFALAYAAHGFAEEDVDFSDFDKEQGKSQVENSDVRALSEAKKANNEAALIKAVSRILGIDANHLEALNTLAVYYFEQQKYGLARIVLLRALKAHPNEAALHNNIGVVYLAENKQRQAIQSFRKALDLKKEYRIGATNLGSIFTEYKDFARAIGPLESGYKLIRSDLRSGRAEAIEVANNYAVALAGTGELDRAKRTFEEILDSNERNPTVLLNYAILLIEKMQNSKAGLKVLSRLKFVVEDPQTNQKIEALERRAAELDKDK